MQAQQKPPSPETETRPARVSLVDWLMLLLAVVSVSLLVWESVWQVDTQTRKWILRTDLIICALFAMEFSWRAAQSPQRWAFIGRNWYEIVGMIPVAHPAIRGFRLFRVIRIIVLLGRFGRAVDRVYGQETFYLWLQIARARFVRIFSGAITVAVLDEVGSVLQKGHYTRNIANALDQNHRQLRSMFSEKLRADPELSRFARLPFFEAIIDTVVTASLRIARETLVDPRTDDLIADALRENLEQLREAVREEDAHRHHEARLPSSERPHTQHSSA